MNRLRIMVADDHEIVRRGLVSLIKSHPDWEVCAEADNGRQAVEKANQSKPDVALVDVSMPGTNGIELLKMMLTEQPRLIVLMISMHDESIYALRALRLAPRDGGVSLMFRHGV